MTAIYCNECGKEISDQAVTCPHCGYSRESEVVVKVTLVNEPAVKIVNIDMPFMSMVNFMAKAILAAVPAVLVVVLFVVAISAFVSGIFR